MIIGSVDHEIKELINQLNKDLKIQQNLYKQCPDGFLITSKRGNKRDYIHCIKKKGTITRHRINSNKALINQLLTKRYCKECIRQLETAIEATKHFMNTFKDPSDENIRMSLYRKYKMDASEILRPVTKTFNKEEYEQFSGFPEGKIHQTSGGFNVRSKSEVLIAEALLNRKIRFHYEEVCHFGPAKCYPDFHCWSRNSEEYYWEHFGMMNNKEYQQRYHIKMNEYENWGIVPWKNLICTFDQEDGRINMKSIYSIIDSRLC